jgi:hypothetical protein
VTRTGTAREAWLLLFKEGGRWTAKDMEQEMGKDVHRNLGRLVDNGYAVKYGEGRNKVSFGVTADCKVPIGVTVKELQQVLGGGA